MKINAEVYFDYNYKTMPGIFSINFEIKKWLINGVKKIDTKLIKCDFIKNIVNGKVDEYLDLKNINMDEKSHIKIVTAEIENIKFNKIVETIQEQLNKNNDKNIAEIINPVLDVLNKNIPDELKEKLIVECVNAGKKGLCSFINKKILLKNFELNVFSINLKIA